MRYSLSKLNAWTCRLGHANHCRLQDWGLDLTIKHLWEASELVHALDWHPCCFNGLGAAACGHNLIACLCQSLCITNALVRLLAVTLCCDPLLRSALHVVKPGLHIKMLDTLSSHKQPAYLAGIRHVEHKLYFNSSNCRMAMPDRDSSTFASSASPVLSDTETRAFLESAQHVAPVSGRCWCRRRSHFSSVMFGISMADIPVLAATAELMLRPILQQSPLSQCLYHE